MGKQVFTATAKKTGSARQRHWSRTNFGGKAVARILVSDSTWPGVRAALPATELLRRRLESRASGRPGSDALKAVARRYRTREADRPGGDRLVQLLPAGRGLRSMPDLWARDRRSRVAWVYSAHDRGWPGQRFPGDWSNSRTGDPEGRSRAQPGRLRRLRSPTARRESYRQADSSSRTVARRRNAGWRALFRG